VTFLCPVVHRNHPGTMDGTRQGRHNLDVTTSLLGLPAPSDWFCALLCLEVSQLASKNTRKRGLLEGGPSSCSVQFKSPHGFSCGLAAGCRVRIQRLWRAPGGQKRQNGTPLKRATAC